MKAVAESRATQVATQVPDLLWSAITAFAAQHPHYAHPEQARDQCRTASGAFCDLLIHMGGPGRPWVDELAVVEGVSHYGAFALGHWIDWTARQFDPVAPFPAIGQEMDPWPYAQGRDAH